MYCMFACTVCTLHSTDGWVQSLDQNPQNKTRIFRFVKISDFGQKFAQFVPREGSRGFGDKPKFQTFKKLPYYC